MHIQAITNILNRELKKEELKQFSSLLDECINFGTHILNWEIEQNKQVRENTVYQTFFKNILEVGDGISILIQNSSVENSKFLFRTLLENIYYLDYLLEKDTQNRALAYFVTSIHNEIKLYKKQDNSSQEGKAFVAELKKDKVFQNIPFIITQIDGRNQIEEWMKLLELSAFKEVETEYRKNALSRNNPTWYSLFDGPHNIEQLAKRLNHHATYELLYRGYSENVHSSSIIKNSLVESQSGFVIGSMREDQDSKLVSLQAMTFLVNVYSDFIMKRIPSKEHIYEEWHTEFTLEFDKLQK